LSQETEKKASLRMKKIQVSLPEELIEKVNRVVGNGLYAGRSEYIRETIRQRLDIEGDLKQ